MESASQLRMLQEITGSEPNETEVAAPGWVQRTGTGAPREWLAAAKQAQNKLPEQCGVDREGAFNSGLQSSLPTPATVKLQIDDLVKMSGCTRPEAQELLESVDWDHDLAAQNIHEKLIPDAASAMLEHGSDMLLSPSSAAILQHKVASLHSSHPFLEVLLLLA